MNEYLDMESVEDLGQPFVLIPKNFDQAAYNERVDRNIGWITRREQEILHFATVGIAGCGGMGGLIAATLLRAGVGHIKIADLEVFDASNLNRQFAAREGSIGLPKVIETARMLREITADSHIYVYPQGIDESSVSDFNEQCNVIADEIEFWAVGARLLLHEALGSKTTILNGNSVGMGTRLFRFRTTSQYKMRDLLRLRLAEAQEIERRVRDKTASIEEIQRVMEVVLKGLVPDIPEYMFSNEGFSTAEQVRKRLFNEGRAPILATNPPMAAGFLANHIILEILRQKSSLSRKIVLPPDMPGYLYFDAALMVAESRVGIWW